MIYIIIQLVSIQNITDINTFPISFLLLFTQNALSIALNNFSLLTLNKTLEIFTSNSANCTKVYLSHF